MAAFEPADISAGRLDFRLLQIGPVHLYWDLAVLSGDQATLAAYGYQVIELNAAEWGSAGDMHADVASKLDFPSYYGRNLNALNDCLRDVAEGYYALDASRAGLVVAIRSYELFVALNTDLAHAILDIFATQARRALLFGNRLLVLAQSDDPGLRVPPIGATPVGWNPAEWRDSTRTP
jgi:hypothetical protein